MELSSPVAVAESLLGLFAPGLGGARSALEICCATQTVLRDRVAELEQYPSINQATASSQEEEEARLVECGCDPLLLVCSNCLTRPSLKRKMENNTTAGIEAALAPVANAAPAVPTAAEETVAIGCTAPESSLESTKIEEAFVVLKRGGTVLCPTNLGWSLLAMETRESSEKLNDIKGRALGKPLGICAIKESFELTFGGKKPPPLTRLKSTADIAISFVSQELVSDETRSRMRQFSTVGPKGEVALWINLGPFCESLAQRLWDECKLSVIGTSGNVSGDGNPKCESYDLNAVDIRIREAVDYILEVPHYSSPDLDKDGRWLSAPMFDMDTLTFRRKGKHMKQVEGILSLYHGMFVDGDNVVGLNEFTAFSKSEIGKGVFHSKDSTDQGIEDQFNLIDVDGSGEIDFDGCLTFVAKQLEEGSNGETHAFKSANVRYGFIELRKQFEKMSDRDFESMFRDMVKDKSGTIDHYELWNCQQKNRWHTANAPIFGVDMDGNVTVWNQQATKVLGFTAAETFGRPFVEDFITKDFRASMQEILDKALRGEETANFQLPLMTKNGARVQTLLNATTRKDAEGRVIGVVGIGQDITARIVLQVQEQEYSRLIDTANAPIFGVDADGNVTVWNKCAANISGFTNEDTLGHHLVNEFITEDFRASVQEVLDKALQGLETANFQLPLITNQGTRVEILLNATSRKDAEGRVIGVVGIGQDITARIAQEQEYSRLIDTANAPIFGVDVEGCVNVWNKCAQALTGYQAQDVIGHRLVDEFVTSNYKQSVHEVLSNAVKGHETANFEFPLIHKDGSHAVQILLNATCRRDDEGRPVGMVGIGQDITDTQARNEAEMRQREAEAAHAAQATISAHVYHEIRNVVGALLALSERALEAVDLALEESSGESIKTLRDEVCFLTEHQRLVCAHAVNTLNDMLDVSRMENGTYKPKSEVIDLGELCQHAAKLQGPRMKPTVQLHLDCPSTGALVVLSDHALLLLYLTNLLSNAAKFTDKGHVMITCHSTPHPADPGWVQVMLGVADTGPGIAPCDQERVLQAFTTGNAVPCEDIGTAVRSTGIGLRLAHLIAQIVGGVTPASVAAEQAASSLGKAGTAKSGSKLLEGLIQQESFDSDGDRSLSVDSTGDCIFQAGGGSGGDGGGHHGGEEAATSTKEAEGQRSILITSPLPKELEMRLAGGGGPGTYLTITATFPLASEERIFSAKSESSSNSESQPGSTNKALPLNSRGILRVLVVDDQRTMRQMVAMLFQKFCQEHPSMRVEVVTALSGEEAVRLALENHFHLVTMDQTLSAGYCKSVKDQQLAAKDVAAAAASTLSGVDAKSSKTVGATMAAATASSSSSGSYNKSDRAAGVEEVECEEAAAAVVVCTPAVLLLDHDRLATAKRKSKFFQDEIYNHVVLNGDGAMDGHVAMQVVLRAYTAAGRKDKPVMFNLTGNVIDADKEKYLAAGSCGVLAKPTKLSDLTDKIQACLDSFLETGIAVTDCRGFVTTPDGQFCYTRITPPSAGLDEELPCFTPSETYGPSLQSSLPPETYAALVAASEQDIGKGNEVVT